MCTVDLENPPYYGFEYSLMADITGPPKCGLVVYTEKISLILPLMDPRFAQPMRRRPVAGPDWRR